MRTLFARGNVGFWVFIVLAFGGSLFWARSIDPYRRLWFTIEPPDGKRAKAIAVMPRLTSPFPTIIFAFDSDASLLQSGNELRQFAEVGFAAIAFDYDQGHQPDFNAQLRSLQQHLRKQPWSKDETIFVGCGLGAQKLLDFVLQHPQAQPAMLVQLSGGLTPELKRFHQLKTNYVNRPFEGPIVLAQGEYDKVFSSSDTRMMAELLRNLGFQTQLHLFADRGHGLDSDRKLFYRVLAEYCQNQLTSGQPIKILPAQTPKAFSFWFCMAPCFLWAGYWIGLPGLRRYHGSDVQPRKYSDKIIRCIAWLSAIVALIHIAWHFAPDALGISKSTLAIARRSLILREWTEDFDALAGHDYWRNHNLRTLLTHIELSNYSVYKMINWKVDRDVYRQFVLSPIIDFENDSELNWRRLLWEFFYPRIRKENNTEAAAQIVVRILRERVTIDPRHPWPTGIETVWRNQITTPHGFERIYVATLRSVGVPARLGERDRTELWTGMEWLAAPRPLIETWLDVETTREPGDG